MRLMSRSMSLLALGIAALLTASGLAPAEAGAQVPPGGTFWDDDGNVHEGMIEAIAAEQITVGCADGGRYCPAERVTRGQMATFIARAFELPPANGDHFPDDGGSVHEPAINALFEAGIAAGYGDGTFRPNDLVARQQMATFLARAMGLAPIPGDRFADVQGIHEPNVNAIADAGVTLGCNEDGTLFCPVDPVRRDQMASFLGRARGLAPVTPPPLRLAWEEVADGFSFPLHVVAAPDGALLVVEKGGRIWRLVGGARTVFLDLRARVSTGAEQGLLGVALHPAFSTNRRFYVHYTNTAGDSRVVEYRAQPDFTVADSGSDRVILGVNQPAANHNGGMIEFGPDGYLYVALGDGGGGGDPYGNGQNRNTVLGAILRIDVDADGFPADPGRNYAIPSGNPYAGGGGAPEVWVYGLRNPWRFSFDSGGRMFIGDVGQNAREEIDVVDAGRSGLNYGWNRLEGSLCYPPGSSCIPAGTVLPVLEYTHEEGRSVIGGVGYDGSAIPALRGAQIYGDLNGWTASFRYLDGRALDRRRWASLSTVGPILSYALDLDGEIVAVTQAGSVLRLVPG
jgi:glucose/arabinose dehydrogenase